MDEFDRVQEIDPAIHKKKSVDYSLEIFVEEVKKLLRMNLYYDNFYFVDGKDIYIIIYNKKIVKYYVDGLSKNSWFPAHNITVEEFLKKPFEKEQV